MLIYCYGYNNVIVITNYIFLLSSLCFLLRNKSLRYNHFSQWISNPNSVCLGPVHILVKTLKQMRDATKYKETKLN